MQVLILFRFLAAMGGLFLLVAVLVWWVMRQIAHAQKYRQLKALIAEAESAMGIAPRLENWFPDEEDARSFDRHGLVATRRRDRVGGTSKRANWTPRQADDAIVVEEVVCQILPSGLA